MVDLFQYRNWAISEAYFRDVAPRIARLLMGGHSLESIITRHTIDSLIPRIQSLLEYQEADASGPAAAITTDASSGLPVVIQNNKSIALIPVVGALTKYGGMCSYGMKDYQQLISKANESPTIDGIVLIMDSPGGTVDGTPEFGMTVRESRKPVGVFGDSLVASAALWVASQAQVVVGNKNNPTQFGSIGTLMVTENWQKMMEAGREPEIEIIRAPQSKDKALVNPVEALSDEARGEVKQHLKALTDLFISTVKSGRGDKLNTNLEGLFTGKMFDVNTAKQNGLIDATGTLQTAVNKVAELARQQAREEGTKQNQNNSSAKTMKLPKLSALLGAAKSLIFGEEPGAKEVSLTTEQAASLEASEKKLSEMESENAQLKADNEEKGKKITSLEAKVASLETEKATLTSEKAELKTKLEAKPAGEATTVIPKEGAAGESKHRAKADDESDEYVAAAAGMNFSTDKTK